MNKMVYEQFREEAVERFAAELRAAFDEVFKFHKKMAKQVATSRLTGLKGAILLALDELAEDGHVKFDIKDVIGQIGRRNHTLAKHIESDPAKKASVSSILRKLSSSREDRMIIVDKLGEGRRPTEYRFSDNILEREARRSEQLGFL